MTTIFLIILGTAFWVLAVVEAMRWPRSILSEFELKRRAKAGEVSAQATLKRQTLRPPLQTLHRLWELFLVMVMAMAAVGAFGWLGVLVVIGQLFLLGLVARLKFVGRVAKWSWPRHERILLKVAEKYPEQIKFFSGILQPEATTSFQLHSRDELLHLIATSGAVLPANEKQLLEKALSFRGRQVQEVMTSRKDIVGVSKDEILGPLTLTALHKAGHSHFPVIDGGLDRIIGILPAHQFMNTERQSEVKVEDVMQRQVFYLAKTQSLHEAVEALLRTRAHLFIVVDNNEKTVGIITFSDIIEALFGRARSGDYQYEDVHAVASLVDAAR